MKRIKYLFLSLAIAATFTNCKKELDLKPIDRFSDSNSFLDLNDVQAGVNGAYGRYINYGNDMFINAILSDEAKIGAQNSGAAAIEYRYQFSSSSEELSALWYGYYSMIDQINRVLPYVETVPGIPAQEPRRTVLKASLFALRGIAHFSLLEGYSKRYDANDPLGIPYVTVSDPLQKPARNTVAQTVTAIENDLATAKAMLPDVTAGDFTDTVISKVNIAAYQARIALYKRDYSAAITYATEVINSNIKPLVRGAAFSGIWNDVNTNEVLFRVRLGESTAIGTLWTGISGSVDIAPSDKLVASYSSDDIRRTSYIGTTLGGDNYVKKFFTSARGARKVDIKAIRTAEMYLIRAEAYAKSATPDLTSAAADLNTLRSFRIDNYVPEVFTTADGLIDAITTERYKELAFEGFRFFDLKRNNLPLQRSATDANPAWQSLPAGSYRFVLPIPKSEILANPNIVQNDQY